MGVYNSIFRHISMPDVKKNALKIQELNRVDELREHQQKILADMYRYDWRSQLSEKMTTAGMSMAALDAEGDVALVTLPNTTVSDSDNVVPYQDYDDPDYAITSQIQSLGRINASKYDTLKLTISGSFNTRTVDGSSLTDTVSIGVKINGTYGGNYLAQGLSAGTHVISIPKRFQKSNIRFDALKVHAIRGVSTPTSITNVQLQRRTPMNVFVSLDDPEASSFIRDGSTDNLSREEKKKKLEDHLKSSQKYLDRMFGEGMPGTATQIADIQPQQSFVDMASDARNPMGTGDQAAAAAALLASPMVQAAAAKGIAALASLVGGVETAKQIMNQINRTSDPYGADLPGATTTGSNPRARNLTPQQQAEVEAAGNELRDAQRALNDLPSDATGAQRDMAQERLDRASKNRQRLRKKHREENKNRKESFEINGEVLSEKRRLKSPKNVVNKIPGYYDGKPAPLGFPIEEPPKMKNGYHPDLVDGKKVANRYNRLDPISAKAMPPTGNPHIDKKVRAAAKKSK